MTRRTRTTKSLGYRISRWRDDRPYRRTWGRWRAEIVLAALGLLIVLWALYQPEWRGMFGW